MALNPSGVMSIGGTTVGASINLELNLSATANSSIGQADFRALAQKPSGVISLSDFYGKSNIIVLPPVTATTANLVITAFGIPGYVAGETKVELTIDSGVYLYSTDTAQPALKFIDFVTGDQITVINNGFIMGMGGIGGGLDNSSTGQPGGPAISTNVNISIVNNSYIGGGGGGGSARVGGGGAGGGRGGYAGTSFPTSNPSAVTGQGGAPGQPGTNGTGFTIQFISVPFQYYLSNGAGGGGGRIMPGIGGAGGTYSSLPGARPTSGAGGGAGGGGAGHVFNLNSSSGEANGGAGGSGGAVGANSTYVGDAPAAGGGGGGGWGASGGRTSTVATPGGIGGKAIVLNGKTATISGTGTIYGAVS
jgi:hypothetical protein